MTDPKPPDQMQLPLLPLWKDQTFVGFDTETTGRFPLVAELCEVAAVKWRAGKIIDKFQSFAKPTIPMGEAVIRIHHITNEMVADAPPIKDVLPLFYNFINDGSTLIAHHAPFDLGFLALEFERNGMALPINKTLCTSILSRRIFPKFINHRLATLVHQFNIKIENAHRALDDSKACLEAGLKCMETVGADVSLEHIFSIQGGPMEWSRYSMKDLRAHPIFSVLVEASEKHLVIEMNYTGGAQPGQPRNVTPHGIVRNPEGDYLVGLCHKENKEKRYYFNRILSAKILD